MSDRLACCGEGLPMRNWKDSGSGGLLLWQGKETVKVGRSMQVYGATGRRLGAFAYSLPIDRKSSVVAKQKEKTTPDQILP